MVLVRWIVDLGRTTLALIEIPSDQATNPPNHRASSGGEENTFISIRPAVCVRKQADLLTFYDFVFQYNFTDVDLTQWHISNRRGRIFHIMCR